MNKKCISILKTISVSACAFLLSCSFIPKFNASPIDLPAYGTMPIQSGNRKFFISNSHDLASCVSTAMQGDEMILMKDITLDTDLCFKTSCVLNLNGFKILIKSNNESIIIGKSEFSHREKYTETIPGYYTYDKKVKTVEHPDRIFTDAYGRSWSVHVPSTQETTTVRIWHPETYETRYRDVYNYDDSIDVEFKNGDIKKSKGKDGADGAIDKSWEESNGQNGVTPTAPIFVTAGTIRLSDVYVNGADGGNGGDGGYQSLWHVALGGGSAGNGGNGGNGGSAIFLSRKEARVVKDASSSLIAGKPGKGGKSGKPNPNYWLYSGSQGENGENGKNVNPVV